MEGTRITYSGNFSRTAFITMCLMAFPAGLSGAPDSSEMVVVPAGEFTQGSSEADITWAARTFFSESLEYYLDETPAQSVHLEAFEIDRTEVTVGQYRRYMEQTGAPPPKFFDNPKLNGDSQPVVGVTWREASEFCAHFGKHLPTESQWEKAARGTDARYYPWGNAPDDTRANVRGRKDGFYYPAPVGSFPNGASPYGALDMAGNVWEWTADWFRPYPGSPAQNDKGSNTFKVIKGGSWFSNMDLARSAVRGKGLPESKLNYIGFRCAR